MRLGNQSYIPHKLDWAAQQKARDEHAEYRAKTARLRQMAETILANENRAGAERQG